MGAHGTLLKKIVVFNGTQKDKILICNLSLNLAMIIH